MPLLQLLVKMCLHSFYLQKSHTDFSLIRGLTKECEAFPKNEKIAEEAPKHLP